VPLRALPVGTQLYEYACHEGNYSIVGALAGARQQERDVREAEAASQGTPE